jgi:iron complex transport system substrate-binding protein
MIMRVSRNAFTSTILASAVLAAACAGCGSSQATSSPASPAASGRAAAGAFPVTVNAANGAVRLSSRPTAIISLSPTATEMLYAIGAGSQVKAVDSDSDYPPQAPKTKLSALTPNVEAIVGYKPDLVIVTSDSASLVKQLAAFKIPVLELPAAAKLADVYAQFDELGQATGHVTQAAQEDTSLRGQLSRITAAAPRHTAPASYYYELDQTYYSVTSATFIGQLLSLLGLKSIADQAKGAAAAGGYPQLSAEYVIKANPDYIILADTICCHQSAATVAARAGWSGLSAVKDGHVIALNDDIASRWGPRITDLLRTVETGIAKGAGK